MKLKGTEKVSAFRSLARFHFICGLPRSGVSVLTSLLSQNPRFRALNNSAAETVFSEMLRFTDKDGQNGELVDDAQRTALLRGAVDSIYHDRPFDSVVFDANRDWLPNMDQIVRLYPLCRFIICVRNPASIVNVMAQEDGVGDNASDLAAIADEVMASDGEVGAEIARVKEALASPFAERILVLEYDRLADDPEEAMDVIYDFLREPIFTHDFEEIAGPGVIEGPVLQDAEMSVLPTRLILQLSGRAFWRNLKRTRATMLLGRAR